MDPEQQASVLLAPTVESLASVKVFPLIPALKRDVTNTIDTALSWEQLTAADINFSIVRPIVGKYARLKNMAVVYVCLVVRSYFLAEAETELAVAGVMLSRASLCEILAMKLLSRFATNYIQLVAVLTTTWNPLAGATNQVVEEVKHVLNDDDIDSVQSAIEMAIATRAKTFLASPVAQQVVNDIYSGRVVFSVTANRSILADNYKPRAIEIYNPHKSPFIDHYRLRVPKYGAYLEFVNFALLLFTFVLCLSNKDSTKVTVWEMAFIILASAFTLEEYTASTEHGWIIYIANMWNAFDFAFIVIFVAYLTMRVRGLSNGDIAASDMAFDVLACGACILFPRLAFFAVSNNVVILSLRAMISQFVFFISIAAICFSGLLFTLWTLASDDPVGHEHWTFKSIAWLMVQIWFGNTYLSFAQASSFHPLFGPILMTIFAALSNTLLLTILISILSNTVARIDANATQEYLFQYTITTIEGVKSDALFSYQPPFNILAFVILKPASWFLTPRALHSFNVFLIKLTSLPQLVIIGYTNGSSSNDLYDAIFDVEINDDEYDIFDESDADHDYSYPQRWWREPSSTQASPKQRVLSPTALSPLEVITTPEIAPLSSNNLSPLARLVSSRFSSIGGLPPNSSAESSNSAMAAQAVVQAAATSEASLKRIESLVEAVGRLPVQKLKDEMKELQVCFSLGSYIYRTLNIRNTTLLRIGKHA
ncbi:hypothetical protein BDZ97DRAFT_1920296 [Flammula alnicola]|nr:hypothetical protein BDZ97DRAFT_1920296 [Flammula alnicola]